MPNDTTLPEALRNLIAQYGLPMVLQILAYVMSESGGITSGVVSEASAIEKWMTERSALEDARTISYASLEALPDSTEH